MTNDVNSLVTNFADVQQQLNGLLVRNRENIDVSLRELQTVVTTLSANRTQLANTLCTLPAGVSPYFQTTSWGEWFNVRVIEVVLKDSNGNVLGRASELPIEHAPKVQASYAACAHGTGGSPKSSSASTKAAGGGSGTGTGFTDASQTFQDVSSLVAFVLGGEPDA
jgi:ABC-type transporter Mla subunit MlaD